MKILIDTHIAIWAVLNDPKLPKRAKEIILNEENVNRVEEQLQ